MANALYPKAKEALESGAIDLLTDDIRVALMHSAGHGFVSTDQFVSDVTAGIVARSTALTSKTVTSGTFDAADETLTAVTGSTVDAIIVYKFNASDTAAALIAWIDHDQAAATFSFTPNGSNVDVQFDAAGIFSI